MKKWSIATIAVVLIISGFFAYKHLNPQIIRPHADFYSYPLEEMESLATVIVEGEWIKEDSSIVKLDKKDKYPLETFTFSDIKVKKVYKGDGIATEDTLKVMEYYAKWNDLAGAYQKMPNELYKPISKGKTYLFFLYSGPTQPKDTFEIIGNHQGKFVVPSSNVKTIKRTTSELDIAEDDQHYRELYDGVTKKYFTQP